MRASVISNNSRQKKGSVTVGREAIVGACALVNQDIPTGATAVGVPCLILRRKDSEHSID